MFIPHSVDQWKTNYYYFIPSLKGATATSPAQTMAGFASIAILTGKQTELILDGYKTALTTAATVGPTSKYTAGHFTVSSGTHYIQHKDGVTTFGIQIYAVDTTTTSSTVCALTTVPDAGLQVMVRINSS